MSLSFWYTKHTTLSCFKGAISCLRTSVHTIRTFLWLTFVPLIQILSYLFLGPRGLYCVAAGRDTGAGAKETKAKARMALTATRATAKARGSTAGAVARGAERAGARRNHHIASRKAAGRRGNGVVLRSMDMFVEDTGGFSTFQTILLVVGGVAGAATGLAVPMFYNTTTEVAAERPNTQTCFSCSGNGSVGCRFCGGTGTISTLLGSGERKESECVNCSGKSFLILPRWGETD